MFDDRPTQDRPLTVSAVTQTIKDVLEGSLLLRGLWVQGEVSNCRQAASGHWYFTLKDSSAALKCVMWKGTSAGQPVLPEDGRALLARGKITVYERSGEYQLQVEQLRPLGVGDLYAELERVKALLVAEGLTDVARKRDLPAFPWRIGVVTSPDAAAFQDVLNVLGRRFPLGRVILSPTAVQGVDAPAGIIRALDRLNSDDVCDVILICRGGGSIEDLWAFNDEQVARAVAASRLPTVTGVGHETDTTLVDFVSDYRAPTPSAAAEYITRVVVDLPAYVAQFRADLDATLKIHLESRRGLLAQLETTMRLYAPNRTIESARQTVDRLTDRMSMRVSTYLDVWGERIAGEIRALDAANPSALLARGYALVRRAADGVLVRLVGQVDVSDELTIQVQDGRFNARVVEEGKLL